MRAMQQQFTTALDSLTRQNVNRRYELRSGGHRRRGVGADMRLLDWRWRSVATAAEAKLMLEVA